MAQKRKLRVSRTGTSQQLNVRPQWSLCVTTKTQNNKPTEQTHNAGEQTCFLFVSSPFSLHGVDSSHLLHVFVRSLACFEYGNQLWLEYLLLQKWKKKQICKCEIVLGVSLDHCHSLIMNQRRTKSLKGLYFIRLKPWGLKRSYI